MGNEFQMEPDSHQRVMDHLLTDSTEQVAFAFAEVSDSGDWLKFKAADLYLVRPDEFELQSGYHVSLTEDCLGRVIKMAWDKRLALVDFHSHTSDLYPAQFSRSDLCGFQEYVPHIWWRLKGTPTMAMVVSPSSFDALVWRKSPDDPERLDRLSIDGEAKQPTSLTMVELEKGHGPRKV